MGRSQGDYEGPAHHLMWWLNVMKGPTCPWWIQFGGNATHADFTACKSLWVVIGIMVKRNFGGYWEHSFLIYQWQYFFRFSWSWKRKCKRLIHSGTGHTGPPALKQLWCRFCVCVFVCESQIQISHALAHKVHVIFEFAILLFHISTTQWFY